MEAVRVLFTDKQMRQSRDRLMHSTRALNVGGRAGPEGEQSLAVGRRVHVDEPLRVGDEDEILGCERKRLLERRREQHRGAQGPKRRWECVRIDTKGAEIPQISLHVGHHIALGLLDGSDTTCFGCQREAQIFKRSRFP